MGHVIVDLTQKQEVRGTLYDLISMDCDLTENEDYFQEDTLELGYESEADRIVTETIKEMGFPKSAKKFEKVANKVFEAISRQEYFGVCELSIINIGDKKVSLAYSYGGDYGN